MQKMIVIGLDSATWSLILPWVKEGKLPTFQRIYEGGTAGVLKSTNPPLTAPGWVAFFTGKHPGKNGVHDFLELHTDRIATGSSVRTETLWEILSRNGKKCIVQNVPMTFPPRKIDGVMITDMMAVPGEIFTHPAELTAQLNAKDYKIDAFFEKPKEKPKAEVVKIVDDIELQHVAVFKELLETHEWDFAMLAMTGLDRLKHYYWEDKELLLHHYQLTDRCIGELMERYGKDTAFAFLSDHGFCSTTTQIDLNFFLEQEGYRAWKKKEATPEGKESQDAQSWLDKRYYKQRRTSITRLLQKMGLTHELLQRSRLLKRVFKLIPKHIRKKLGKSVPQDSRVVDWSKTMAYVPSSLARGMNINLKGREEHGIVEPTDYIRVRTEIIEKMKALQTPEGKPVFASVQSQDEAYTGPFSREGYDILFEVTDWNYLPVAKKTKSLFSPATHAGYHHVDGMYAFIGEGIQPNTHPQAHLVDLAPTMLHYFDLPIPSDMDGQVIQDAFTTQKEARKESNTSSEKQSISSALKGIRL